MNLIEAKQRAKELAQQGHEVSVVYRDLTSKEFDVVETNRLGDRFPHYHAHEWLPTKLATFVIASYNDDARLDDTLKSIYNSCDPKEFSIIVVMDGASGKNKYRHKYPELTMLWHGERKGVGACFDTAMPHVLTEQVMLMGADVRFPEWDKTWMPRFVDKVRRNPKAIICTKCGKLNKDNLWLKPDTHAYTGAGIKFRHPQSKLEFRAMLEAEWMKVEGNGLQPVGCVLGAFYGINRSWYKEIRGFEGHRTWGTLEPLISLRSVLLGGKCLIDMDLTVGHIFLTEGSNKSIVDIIFNKLLVADTLLTDEMREEVFTWANGINFGKVAIKLYEDDAKAKELKQYFKEAAPGKKAIVGRLRKSFKDLG